VQVRWDEFQAALQTQLLPLSLRVAVNDFLAPLPPRALELSVLGLSDGDAVDGDAVDGDAVDGNAVDGDVAALVSSTQASRAVWAALL
jgi:hypothetical protein